MTESRKKELSLLWANEPITNNSSWRKTLTPEEAHLVAQWERNNPLEERLALFEFIRQREIEKYGSADKMEFLEFNDVQYSLEDFERYPSFECRKQEVPITDDLLAKIDRFADREAKVIASKMRRFVSAVENTDFSHTDPKSYYEVRDLINHLAEKYGIQWVKTDTDSVCWQYEGSFKIQKDCFTGFVIGDGIDYYGTSPEKLSTILPEFVVRKFGAYTIDSIRESIKEQLLDAIKEGRFWD